MSSVQKDWVGWGGGGVVLCVLGALFYFLFWLQGRKLFGPRGWEQSSLVVGPEGLALVQGHLKGELRWDELRDVQMWSKPRGFQLSQADSYPGIALSVEGARIVIADIYDRPLYFIRDCIKRYWR
jgi:hypothetical protein